MLCFLSMTSWARHAVLKPRRKKKATSAEVIQILESLEDRTLLSAITVNSLDDNLTSGDGLVTLREAIIAANTDGTTDLGDTGNGADSITFDIGVGSNTMTLLLGQLVVTSDLTIAGPGSNRLTISGNNTNRIFEFTFTAVADFSGLRLTGGLSTLNGGAIQNSGQLTLTDMQIDGNIGSGGGGIFNTGTLNIFNTSIENNQATSVGGGLMNMATGVVKIANSSISKNLSQFDGGGIVNLGSISLLGSSVSGNTTGADGGGIVNIRGGSVIVSQGSVVSNNHADSDSGGLFNDTGSTVIVTESLFSGNTANDFAGAIRNLGNFEMFNSTISGNSAGTDGGGIFSTGFTKLVNVTVSANQADADRNGTGSGGGIVQSSSVGLTSIDNSIVAGNLVGGTANEIAGTLVSTSSFNLIGDASSSGGLINAVNGNIVGSDPLLGPLQDHGGATFTHALLAGSAAIDAGSNALAVDGNGNPLNFDQRGTGFTRFQNGTVDIGAFEAVIIDTNTPPIAIDDSFTTTEDASLTMDVLANDSDPDGDHLTVVVVTQAAHGKVSINHDNTISYTPDVNFSGSDTFTYEISDGEGGTSTATVRIEVFSQQAQLDHMERSIRELIANRSLKKGQGKLLISKLKKIGRKLNRHGKEKDHEHEKERDRRHGKERHHEHGKERHHEHEKEKEEIQDALHQLKAFVKRINAFVQSGKLSAAQGQQFLLASQNLHQSMVIGAGESSKFDDNDCYFCTESD